MNKVVVKEKGSLRLNGITSAHIRKLLEVKHSGDVLVFECKNGETWGARDLLKLDAWVLKKTYSPLTIVGYEIKTNRQDFEKDQKWTKYLDLCHQFYFICPSGMIRATDLPNQIGIMWASKERLHTKRKAERVEPDMGKLNALLIYILMSRTKIVANMNEINTVEEDRLSRIRREIEESSARKELASIVGGHVRETYERVMQIDRTLSSRESDIKSFQEKLAKLGIIWNPEEKSWMHQHQVESEIDLLCKQIDWKTLQEMKNIGSQMKDVAERIEGYRKHQGRT